VSSITDLKKVHKRLNKGHQFWKWHELQSSKNSVINQNMQPQTRQATYLTHKLLLYSALQSHWSDSRVTVYSAKGIYVHSFTAVIPCHKRKSIHQQS
jgi:hypothetical protein